MQFAGMSVVVVGLARSGVAVAKLLRQLGAHVTVNDAAERASVDGQASELEQEGISVVTGGHPLSLLDHCDLVVKNPGIPYDRPFIRHALSLGLPVVTEVEIAWQVTDAPILGITGSNGKTTTTTLVGDMFAQAGLPAVVAGNIGTALSAVAKDVAADHWLIVELSSFQLAGTKTFRPRIAAMLNVYAAHLDYHGTFAHYIESKKRIFANQTVDDIAILSADCNEVAAIAREVAATVWWFSKTRAVHPGVYVADGVIYYSAPHIAGTLEDAPIPILPVSQIALRGGHNLENALAASALALAAGVPLAAVRATLTTLSGVEHRLEFVRSVRGVHYYNDSKATNPQAALSAIAAFTEPLVMIMGGLERGDDLSPLISAVQKHAKAVVTLGESGARMASMAEEAGIPDIRSASSLREAVRLAAACAATGDVVLLSPAAASWDMFSSFEERGGIFKQEVHML